MLVWLYWVLLKFNFNFTENSDFIYQLCLVFLLSLSSDWCKHSLVLSKRDRPFSLLGQFRKAFCSFRVNLAWKRTICLAVEARFKLLSRLIQTNLFCQVVFQSVGNIFYHSLNERFEWFKLEKHEAYLDNLYRSE